MSDYSLYSTAPAAPRMVEEKEQPRGIRKALRNFGVMVTRGLATIGGFIYKHPNPWGYIFLLVVAVFIPYLAIFFIGCLLCHAYWVSGKP